MAPMLPVLPMLPSPRAPPTSKGGARGRWRDISEGPSPAWLCEEGAPLLPQQARHSPSRLQLLTLARPTDNAGRVRASVNPAFAMDATIYRTLPSCSLRRFFQRASIDVRLVWDAAAKRAICAAYAKLGPAPAIDRDGALLAFMLKECDFSMEHADGSFLDHLRFCSEYSARHYAAVSPRIMLVHSILGVGTNCFPMGVEKLPQLARLLDADEFAHVEAFPSVLRLLVHGPLLERLERLCAAGLLHKVRGLRLQRLIDNETIRLDGVQLCEQLNLQLIHALDFLPTVAWRRTRNAYFFSIFTRLHALLTRARLLKARVEWEYAPGACCAPEARPCSWRHLVADAVPSALVLWLAANQIAEYSARVNHSLAFELY
jgi:hypothetical protein